MAGAIEWLLTCGIAALSGRACLGSGRQEAGGEGPQHTTPNHPSETKTEQHGGGEITLADTAQGHGTFRGVMDVVTSHSIRPMTVLGNNHVMFKVGHVGHGASPGVVGGLLLWPLQSQQRRPLPTSPARIQHNPNTEDQSRATSVSVWKEEERSLSVGAGKCSCSAEQWINSLQIKIV